LVAAEVSTVTKIKAARLMARWCAPLPNKGVKEYRQPRPFSHAVRRKYFLRVFVLEG
jgi:hypothetical protein